MKVRQNKTMVVDGGFGEGKTIDSCKASMFGELATREVTRNLWKYSSSSLLSSS